jgi:hypothetical protein
VTTPNAEIRDSAASLARRARRDLIALVLIVAGAGGFLVAAWMVDWRAALAVLSLYVAGAGAVVGMDREGARS